MKFVIQRVINASVEVDGKVVGKTEKGYLVLLGACNDDTKEIADKMVKKLVGLRIFDDENGKTNLSINDVGGQMLVVSQFTLYADCSHGNRPSFINAGDPAHANELYEYVVNELRETYGIHTETGIFGAEMKVSLLNDGPFTILLDSDEIFSKGK
ncbi:MAG: D-tyrosyl-tRNA(Tyr) deacylase [Lachnospiraceae bacterium]|nr:D-tyrosyl-tRNA(Tyr) deacylase [Lachnospiraceae bacterium]